MVVFVCVFSWGREGVSVSFLGGGCVCEFREWDIVSVCE